MRKKLVCNNCCSHLIATDKDVKKRNGRTVVLCPICKNEVEYND